MASGSFDAAVIAAGDALAPGHEPTTPDEFRAVPMDWHPPSLVGRLSRRRPRKQMLRWVVSAARAGDPRKPCRPDGLPG
jgi:hypothetical protein